MNNIEIDNLADSALNAACAVIQAKLGITSGDFAARFFSDGMVLNTLRGYILTELAERTALQAPAPKPTRHTLYGRSFAILAEFPDTDEGTAQANVFMEANADTGVLEVVDGRVIIASNSDAGILLRPKHLECCCCGGDAGKFTQWHNRDDGYGVCRACVDWMVNRSTSADELRKDYGIEGVHYAAA